MQAVVLDIPVIILQHVNNGLVIKATPTTSFVSWLYPTRLLTKGYKINQNIFSEKSEPDF